jgi:PKD repeat protein
MARRRKLAALLLATLLAPGVASQVDFTASVTSGSIPLTVEFEDITPGATADALWFFGQGPLPIGQGQTVEFTYTQPGTYDVAMTTYTGNPPVPTQLVKPGFIQVDTVPLDAGFDWSVSIGGVPVEVQFTDQTTGGVPTAWHWDFGDGTTSTEQHPIHVYMEPGNYPVVLDATFHGISDVQTAPFAVTALPVVQLEEPVVQAVDPGVGADMLIAELDGDGTPDLITATLQTFQLADKRVIGVLNEGDGTLGTAVTTLLTDNPWYWAAGDLDGDGLDDLVLTRRDFPSNVNALLSDGAGGFGLSFVHILPFTNTKTQVLLFDADEDGALDLLTYRANSMVLSSGDGAGGFEASGPDLPLVNSKPLQSAAARDLDGDGHLDVILASASAGSSVSWGVAHGDGAGGFVAAPVVPDPETAASSTQLMAVGDFDGDGLVDAVLPFFHNVGGGDWVYQVASGDGETLVSSVPQDLSIVPGFMGHLAVGDVDLDGVDDVFTEKLASVQLGGAHFPTARQPLIGPYPTPNDVALADMDGDGRADLLTTHFASGWNLVTFRNVSVPPGWTDLGEALAGTHGEPVLTGTGALTAGASTTLSLTNARANALTATFIGFTDARVPFKGGVLVPSPDEVLLGPVTDGQGELVLSAPWLPGIGPGVHVWWQVWIADPAATKGAAASNAIVSRT